MKLLMRSVTPAGAAIPVLALTVSTYQDAGYNLATAVAAALGGPPGSALRIVLTINPGARIKVLTSGTFPSGSEFRLINKGVCWGAGGVGGNAGSNGGNGGAAIVVSTSSGLASIEIDNGAGYILGGGAGGKGGTGSNGGGGGGGAGHGNGGSPAGTGNAGAEGKGVPWNGAGWNNLTNAGGRGGTAGASSTAGNDGTNWGTAGIAGDGTPGKAIELNGNVSPTFLSGNTSDRVKGAVS